MLTPFPPRRFRFHTRCVSAYMLFCSDFVSLNTFTVQ